MTLKERLNGYRDLILTIELAGLLHDSGKLFSEFINYRKVWQQKKGLEDPHDNNFFDNDPLLQDDSLRLLKEYLSKNISSYLSINEVWKSGLSVDTEISLKEIMHQHTRPRHEISYFLKLGDSVDSAYDRNNPLMAMEQFDKDVTYSSTVFGYESLLPVNSFDDKRKVLYCRLNNILPSYLKNFDSIERSNIFTSVEEAFKFAVTDTCRPANDIPLWQHSYVTSALTKVFFVHFLIYGDKLQRLEEAIFSLIGFGWDGMSFISRGHKIGDITAKKQIIKKLKERIKEILEYQYPIGMNVYDDDNGIYFVAPAIYESANEYKGLLEEIREEVNQIADDITGGEIQPVFSDKVSKTGFIMEIVDSINDIAIKSRYVYTSINKKLLWMKMWEDTKGKAICDICQKRPVINIRQNICDVCRERRIHSQRIHSQRLRDVDIQQSIFSDEIADGNGRLALICAKFSLEPWLKGDMIWSLFVKEANSLKEAISHLEKIEDLKDADKKRREIIENKKGSIENLTYNYNEIIKDIDICKKAADPKSTIDNGDRQFAEAISFLFDRHSDKPGVPRDWRDKEKWIEGVNQRLKIEKRFNEKPDFYNYLLTKNHTPSRILNIWNTTRDFLRDVFELHNLKQEGFLSSFKRIILKLDTPSHLSIEHAVYEAEIDGKFVDVFRDGKDVFVINEGYKGINLEDVRSWERRKIKIRPSEFEKDKDDIKEAEIKEVLQDEYDTYPYRVITTTPDILMAVVPADKAVEISDYIYTQYKKYFGKVLGRLPFSIGNVFFPKKTPMFVVLDAGRRMLKNFEKINERHWEKGQVLEIRDDVKINDGIVTLTFKNNLQWQVNCNLGNGGPDFFHPYLIVTDSENGRHKQKGSYFKTFLGDLVHFTHIKKDFKVKVYPNFYDFEFLDSNTRRHDINLDDDLKRKSNLANFKSKPFLLDELGQKIMCLWIDLLQGKQLKEITDTKLRNLQSLWLTKYQEWNVDMNNKSSPNYKQWIGLVISSIQKEFKDLDDKHCSMLLETIENGLFFDTLELYLRILKERIDEK